MKLSKVICVLAGACLFAVGLSFSPSHAHFAFQPFQAKKAFNGGASGPSGERFRSSGFVGQDSKESMKKGGSLAFSQNFAFDSSEPIPASKSLARYFSTGGSKKDFSSLLGGKVGSSGKSQGRNSRFVQDIVAMNNPLSKSGSDGKEHFFDLSHFSSGDGPSKYQSSKSRSKSGGGGAGGSDFSFEDRYSTEPKYGDKGGSKYGEDCKVTGTPEPSAAVVWTLVAGCGYGIVRNRKRLLSSELE